MENLANVTNYSIAPTGVLNSSLYDDFFRFIDVKEKSIATYKRALKQFFNYLQDNFIETPTRETIIAFREELKATHKPTTVQGYITAIRLFFRWTCLIGKYPNIADHIKGAKVSHNHKKDYLTANQVKKVLKTINRKTPRGKRDYAILSLMITGGLRTIEVSRANIEDVRTLGANTVLYIQGKGRDEKTEYVKLPFKVEEAIRDYINSLGAVDIKSPLFSSASNNNRGERLTTRTISGIVKECLKKAGFNSDRLTAHSLRHTTATLNLLEGGTLEETQQLLRHTNINTTMVYLHHIQRENNQSEERVAKAIF